MKIPEDLHERFRKFARSQRRNIQDQIMWMMEEAIAEYEREEIDRVSTAENNQAGPSLGKASAQPGLEESTL